MALRPLDRRKGPRSTAAAALCAALLLASSRPAAATEALLTGLDEPQALALDLVHKQLYWTEAGARTLSRAFLNGSGVEVVVPPSPSQEESPKGVAVDPTGSKVYWTTACCSIFRANLDGSEAEEVVSDTLASGIALDFIGEKLYWASTVAGAIYRANLDGSDSEVFVDSGVDKPVDLALDRVRRKAYWADLEKRTVERASLDSGSDVEVLNVSWLVDQTNGLVVDPFDGRIYLTGSSEPAAGDSGSSADADDDTSGSIYRASLSGSDSEVLLSGQGVQSPYGIEYDHEEHVVYWTDQVAGTIQRLMLQCLPGYYTVASRVNAASTAQVWHGHMLRSSLATVMCPTGYSGSVRLMCGDEGEVSLSSGHCEKNCLAGKIQEGVSGTSIAYGALKSGASTLVQCGEGLVGPLNVSCSDGEVSIVSGSCRKPRDCASGSMTLRETALVEHGEITHGGSVNVSCPEGFDGGYELRCNDGTVAVVAGICHASCEEGSLWVEHRPGFAVEVPHNAIRPGFSLRVPCPEGYAGEGVQLECTRGQFLRILQAHCIRTMSCEAGNQTVNGAIIAHNTMTEGDSYPRTCPHGYQGIVTLSCAEGFVNITGSCSSNCEAGSIEDANNITVHHGVMHHRSKWLAVCPSGFRGVIPLWCDDGNLSIDCGMEDQSRCMCQRMLPVFEEEHSNHAPLGLLLPFAGALSIAVVAGVAGWQAARCRRRKTGARSPCTSPTAMPSKAAKCIAETFGWPGSPSGGDASTVNPDHSTDLSQVVVDTMVPLPSYWATQDGVHIFPDPNRIAEAQRLMSETWRVCYTRDRRLAGGGDRLPIGCRVANVLRIENHPGFEAYWKHKAEVSERLGIDCEQFETETDNRLNLLDSDCNEKYLFHGTKPEAAHAIARNLFRIELAGSSRGCMFGPGIYLAENASKSDEYAREGSGVYVGLCAMLVCRAVAGKVLKVQSSGDFSEQVKSEDYDSLCGDRLAAAGTFREMVFFQEQAVYPEFIVIYARVYDG